MKGLFFGFTLETSLFTLETSHHRKKKTLDEHSCILGAMIFLKTSVKGNQKGTKRDRVREVEFD